LITLFSIPKAFHGHTGTIQRNAIKSWTLLHPDCEVILLADDDGTAEAAQDLGVKHISNVARNEFGTPLLDSAYRLAEEASSFPLLCYVNADIILMSDLIQAVEAVKAKTDWFLMTGQRRDLEVESLLDFGGDWEERLRKNVSERGRLHHFTGIDFWAYSKGLLSDMPPLAVGRIAFESWCLYKARAANADVVDSTETVYSIHQEHDYSHHPGGLIGIGTGVEAQRNREMVGGKDYFFIIKDRTHILSEKGLRRSLDGWRLWRGLRTAKVLHPSAPLSIKLVTRSINATIDFGITFAKRLGIKRPYRLNIDLTNEK